MSTGQSASRWWIGPLAALLAIGGAGSCDDEAVSPFPEDQWAYARVITDEGDLIGGPVAQGRLGDVLIGNGRVRFIVQGQDNPRGYLVYGGTLLDADVVRPAGEPGQDRLGEIATIAGYIRFVASETVEVLHDGSGGRPAVVRVTGVDRGFPLLESALPLDPSEVEVRTDYILEPEATSLIIETTATYVGTRSSMTLKVGDGVMMSDLSTVCSGPDEGCEGSASGRTGLLGAYAPGAVSYGYFHEADDMRVELNLDALALVMGAGTPLAPGESVTVRRYLAVGQGDMTTVWSEVMRRRGEAVRYAVSGRVELAPSGDDAVGAAVDVYAAEGDWVTRAVADEAGEFTARVAPGEYRLIARLPARDAVESDALDATVGDVTGIELTLDDPARVAVDVRDAQGRPVPARVAFLAGTDPPLGAGDVMTIYSLDGSGEGVLPPGDYVAAVTRGYEYDYDWVPVTAVRGETVTVQASIAHVVDTTGYLAVDPHTHTRFSMDNNFDENERVAQATAEQVEVVVTTEHDYISDLQPPIDAAGVEDLVLTAPGVEITTAPWHLNAFPVNPEGAIRPGYYPVVWWETDADGEFAGLRPIPDVFQDARDALEAGIIQLNHPRYPALGILDYVGYDPAVGFGPGGVDADELPTSFDTVEICNESWGDDDLEALQDWYSFLNQGLRTTGTGSSDSHGLWTMLGLCRTLVEVDDDEVTAGLDLQPVWDAMRTQRATVMSGPFVLLWALDDADQPFGMGRVATRTTGPVSLRVQIQAAPFVQTSRLILVGNGQVVYTEDLPDPGAPPAVIRYDATIDVDWQGGDAWFVAIVEGDTPMWPLIDEVPRSVTNPVYVDRDGDSTWTAPGL